MTSKRLMIRSGFIKFLILIIATLIMLRLVFFQTNSDSFLKAQGDARTVRTKPITAYRGMLSDKFGSPLAVSTPMYHMWVNPKYFDPDAWELAALVDTLSVSTPYIESRRDQKDKQFVYLKKSVSPQQRDALLKMRIKGLHAEQVFKRYYPAGDATSQLIGYTNADDKGQSGLEYAYNQILTPHMGQKKVLEDAHGNLIEEIEVTHQPKPGADLSLTLDLRLQSYAMQVMQETVEKTKAKWGLFVVLNVEDNGVLAIGNYPSFNPNDTEARQGDQARLKAIVDQYEPGSILKPIALLSAMEHDGFDRSEIINTHPGSWKVHNNIVKDVSNKGKMSVQDILKYSSNVAVSKLVLRYPAQDLLDTYRLLGLGGEALTAFPAEVTGQLPDRVKDDSFVLATLSMGYALAVPPLQVANAYGTIARRGQAMPLKLIEDGYAKRSQRILHAAQCQQILSYMNKVVSPTGTGKRAVIPGYQIAGKTGTVRLVGESGYDSDRHLSQFVGIVPVEHPKFVILVMVDEPQTAYYGGLISAPVFKDIASKALQLYQIFGDTA